MEPMVATAHTWTPDSWRRHPALQQPEWPDAAAADAARERLKGSPPLVFAGEARDLQDRLAQALAGKAFLLQAGDCVESFNELSTMRIREKLKIMLQMSAVLTYGATLPVVKLGRMAGQFTKPRSDAFETVGGEQIPSFRGHMVNSEVPIHLFAVRFARFSVASSLGVRRRLISSGSVTSLIALAISPASVVGVCVYAFDMIMLMPLTIMAIAWRSTDYLLDQLKKGNL